MSGEKRATKLTSKHLAYKALGLADISRSQCKVGIAIIDHMNIRTGRCDPGLRRLASDTLLTVETVRVSVARLCDPNAPGRLFDNLNPGQGKSPRYVPRWAIMKAMVDNFEARTMSPTVQQTLDSSNLETVQPHLDSDCPEPNPSTVQQPLDKTNLRTKGARPAASQAAGPVRAPLKETAEKNAQPTGPPFPLPPVSEEAEVPLRPELPHTAMVRREPTEASRAHVSATYEKFLREQQPVGPTWPRGGGHKRP